MVIGAICEREDPRDAVIMHPKHPDASLATLPKDAVIGESVLAIAGTMIIWIPPGSMLV